MNFKELLIDIKNASKIVWKYKRIIGIIALILLALKLLADSQIFCNNPLIPFLCNN